MFDDHKTINIWLQIAQEIDEVILANTHVVLKEGQNNFIWGRCKTSLIISLVVRIVYIILSFTQNKEDM